MSDDRSASTRPARPLLENAGAGATGRHVDEGALRAADEEQAASGEAARVRAALDARWRAIGAEIAHYPTPIARCDVQLPALLDARDELRRLRGIDDDVALVAAYARALAGWGQS